MKRKNALFIILLVFLFTFECAVASTFDTNEDKNKGFFKTIGTEFKKTWESDILDIYVPINTWHNRSMYDKEKTDKYNEKPWGIGIGKGRIGDTGNLHQIYIMEFQDSHNSLEVIFGYNYQWKWHFDKKKDFGVGLGGTIGATFRADFSTPLVLPIFSLSYKGISLVTTYIPGTYNNMNVLFTWVRFSFKI